jgi:hypothetical protein
VIPTRLRYYWFEGVNPTTKDITDYSNYLSSEKDKQGSSTGSDTNKANNMGGMVKAKVGPSTGIYDPELALVLGLEGS